MARAEATWVDSSGSERAATGMLEETSSHGACLRLDQRIQVGSRITVKWMREQFLGTVRHCKREESGYVVGIERDAHVVKPAPEPRGASSGKANA